MLYTPSDLALGERLAGHCSGWSGAPHRAVLWLFIGLIAHGVIMCLKDVVGHWKDESSPLLFPFPVFLTLCTQTTVPSKQVCLPDQQWLGDQGTDATSFDFLVNSQ